MKERINLQFKQGQPPQLVALARSEKLRIAPSMVWFVIDTGSPMTFFSQAETKILKIPLEGRREKEVIQFGGFNFKSIETEDFNIYMLIDKNNFNITHKMDAIKVTRMSEDARIKAESLPSIMGMDFLKKHNLSLHIYPAEELACLQRED